MSQLMTIVDAAKNGSMQAELGSGIRVMSDSLIAFQPAIEEPSNIRPSAKASSSIKVWSNVTCCHLPRGSVKRKSTYFTSFSLIALSTSLAVFMIYLPILVSLDPARRGEAAGSTGMAASLQGGLDRVRAGLAGADADGLVDGGNENLAVADSARLRRLADRLDRSVEILV